MSEKISTVNCTASKPSFGAKVDVARLEETTDLLRGIDLQKVKSGNIDEDTIERIKDYVNGIEVDENSKVKGPLKTLFLSLLTLGTGALVAKGTANRFFYMIKDKPIVQKMFEKIAVSFDKLSKNIASKAEFNKTAGAARKYFFQALDIVSKKVGEFLSKGTNGLTAQGEKFTKAAFNTVGATAGLTTTGMALAVDKDKDGQSDLLQSNNEENKRTQKAVLDFANVVIDNI